MSACAVHVGLHTRGIKWTGTCRAPAWRNNARGTFLLGLAAMRAPSKQCVCATCRGGTTSVRVPRQAGYKSDAGCRGQQAAAAKSYPAQQQAFGQPYTRRPPDDRQPVKASLLPHGRHRQRIEGRGHLPCSPLRRLALIQAGALARPGPRYARRCGVFLSKPASNGCGFWDVSSCESSEA